ncbi:choline/glycine/proline betaine transport protein [Draconibacterium orientale]|jgi:choline/glycine/proline betaine transport protein|uniref:Choline transporter n=1 Tax=Draconibacterium orientale TaxID=1168034 RepID=X5DZ49_9BACT|nr:BCCT family transporter [Draconibacterium orientale]AHW59586.1 choline transporter [Draconibacterium orientale]SES83855.1 choline/glycine/proline betaine transport protein [Draconibacterium orientale]
MAEKENVPHKGEAHLVSSNKYFDVDGPVFWPAAILIVLFIAVTLIVGQPMNKVFSTIQSSISDYGGWFFVISVNIFLFFVLFIAFSKFGKIKLGGSKAKPEFSKGAWFAMLFSAGMGIGILFWSVGEPINHFIHPPSGEARTVEAARMSLEITFLHWGLHAWGIYALVGMSLAFFTFNKKLPLTISSIFYPLLGRKIYGPWGKAINVLAVVSTLFGLATSLGMGVQQVSAGLAHLFNMPDTITSQVILITVITFAATGSVIAGLSGGVKRLSELNMIIAAVFLLFMIIVGPTLFIFDSFIQNLGGYVQKFFELSTWTETYQQSDWQNDWTVFYWAWWISWSPFVGMFIARISRGRTLKEFVLGVLIVPTLITFLWLSTFGGSAMFLELNSIADVAGAVTDNVATSLYVLLEQFPISTVTSTVGVILVTSFFITSSDSGSLVVDSLTAGGKLDAPVPQRIFWALTEGAVAAVLLVGGGLGALQTAAISTGLPFAIILLFLVWSLLKGLRAEHRDLMEVKREKEHKEYLETISRMLQKRGKTQSVPKQQENKDNS